jgi:predicted nucleotidyltransferase
MHDRRLLETLRRLEESKTQFIVVGGVAAVLNGAPVQTFDIDIVYSASEENIDRLLVALASLDAVFRIQPERRLQPRASHLSGKGHLNLLTSAGPLDLLGTIGQNLSYEDLLSHCLEMDIGGGLRVKVLDLETLISVKELLGGDKDLAVLPILRQTLRELRKKDHP